VVKQTVCFSSVFCWQMERWFDIPVDR
jgi:hypothetical protein